MTPDDLAVMVEKVVASPTLPRRYRDRARRLLGLPPDQLIRVQSELGRLADEYARDAAYRSPTTDLYRVVPVRAVQRHMAEPSLRAIDVRTYLAEAEASGDPALWVRRTIPAGAVVFPRERSWLIDCPDLPAMTARQLKTSLELHDSQQPPFLVFRLTPARMTAAGVLVRAPNALDAAAAGQPQWSPGGLQMGPEYLDNAVVIEAVEDVMWRS